MHVYKNGSKLEIRLTTKDAHTANNVSNYTYSIRYISQKKLDWHVFLKE